MSKFVARLKKKNSDPQKSIWAIVWGSKEKDLDIYTPLVNVLCDLYPEELMYEVPWTDFR